MKNSTLFYALLLFACSFLSLTTEVSAQDDTPLSKAETDRIDSLKASYDAEEDRVEQRSKDRKNLSELKSEKTDSKMQARKAKKIEREANTAARESRIAYRSEKQAQKSRKQADKHAKKAAKARGISDKN